jgi:hypothetical protein
VVDWWARPGDNPCEHIDMVTVWRSCIYGHHGLNYVSEGAGAVLGADGTPIEMICRGEALFLGGGGSKG